MPTFNIDEVELVQPPQKGKSGDKGDEQKDKGEGEKGEPGEGSGGDETEEDLDKVHKEIEDRLSKKRDIKSEKDAAEQRQQEWERAQEASRSGQPGKGGGVGTPEGERPLYDAPRYNWKRLVKMMVPSGAPRKDTSYRKPDPRGVTSAHVAAQTGAGALKPGQIPQEVKTRKLALVFDVSGSMYVACEKAMSQMPSLLKATDFADAPIAVIFFAGDMKLYTVNIRQNTYQKVENMTDLGKIDKAQQKKNYMSLFTVPGGGGTEFGPHVLTEINTLIGQDYNVIMFSDQDVMYGDNWKSFTWLAMKNKEHFAFIADNKETWQAICNKLKMAPPKFGYLD